MSSSFLEATISSLSLSSYYAQCVITELNAILNKNSADVKGCTLYVALFPCNECAKLVIQSGISRVLYVSDKYHDNEEMVASRKLLDMAGVIYRYSYLTHHVACCCWLTNQVLVLLYNKLFFLEDMSNKLCLYNAHTQE